MTITGAFDGAFATFFGGIVLTDNHARRILKRDRFSEDVVAVVHIPDRTIRKENLRRLDFGPIRPQVEAAFRLAERGEYFRAMDTNSGAYAAVLGGGEAAAVRARGAGALAAGISGPGPAIIALAERSELQPVQEALSEPASLVP